MALTITKGTADEVSGVVSGSTLVAHSVTSFSPAAGEMVRVLVAALNATDHLGDTYTCVDSHGTSFGTPTLAGNPGDGDGGCYLFVWDHVYATAPGATTLTITKTNGNAQADFLIQANRISGYDPDQSTAAHNVFSEAGTPTTTYEIAVTTTRAGSVVFVLAAPNHNGGATGPVTAIAGTTTDVDWDNGNVGSRGTFGRSTSPTVTPGSTTFGWTSANPSPNGYGVMALELLPATGIARDQTATLADGANPATISVVWPTAPAAGAKAFVFVGLTGGTVTGVTDNGTTPATWTKDVDNSGLIHLWRADGITLPASGNFTVSVTVSGGSGNDYVAGGRTYTGVAAGGPSSSNGTAQGTSNSVNTGNLTPPAIGSLKIGGFVDDTGAAQTITLTTSGANQVFSQPNGSAAFAGAGADHITTASGAQSLAWTITNSPDWATVYAVYAAAAGTSHSASASLTVTPSFSAVPSARQRSASLTVTPTFTAAATGGAPTFTASASLTVVPSFGAAAQVTRHASASLTVTPSFSAARTGAHFASASLTVTPVFSAAPHAVHFRSASLTVTPVLTASASKATGALPGYPGSVVDAQVELFLGGAWTDVTDVALPDGQQYGSIKSGQPDGAQQPSPASMNAVWDNPDYSLSPRNSAGPYFGQLRQNTPARVSVASVLGTRLRLENDSQDMASVADTSALHVTGSIEIRIGVILSDWRSCTMTARNDGTTPSWSLILNSDGTLSFFWYDSGGTLHHVDSPAAAGVSWRAFRVTMDSSNGNVQFFLSDDIDGTWTSMGAAASGTSGAATSVRAGNSPLVIGWSAAGGTQMRGTVTAFRMYNGLSASGGTVVADAGFAAQLPGTTSWTDTAGRSWTLSGGAEISARDYRMFGELSALNPTAAVSGGMPRLQATLSGRLRRLQQGAAPSADSAMKRAVMSQTGSLFPVGYWPMEDGPVAKTFGAAVGANGLVASLGKVKAAADSSFEASAPLPTLNADSLSVTVDSYSGATAWAVRFLWKEGQTLPASGSVRLIEITATGAVTKLQVVVNSDGTVNFKGFLSNGSAAWTESAEESFPQIGSPGWWSVEATPSGSNATYGLVALAPGASSGNVDSHTVTGHGSFGTVTAITVNPDLALDDSVFGHLSVQKAWSSLFDLGKPLNAWRNELADVRFARICAENNIPCRILGRSVVTQAMGPQPRGSVWTILKDCVNTEQGIAYEPWWCCFGLGFRTREALGAQSPAVTVSFADSNLRGDLQPADDDAGFLNDVTGQMPDGTSWRAVLDDGSANSVSEPKDGGRGRYAGSVPFPLNVADASELPSAVQFYLGRSSVDEPRYRNIVMDLGIPGAPTDDIARLRPGDLVKITDVPGIYQDSDIEQLAMGFTEAFGPGRRVTCDCIPWSPYSI